MIFNLRYMVAQKSDEVRKKDADGNTIEEEQKIQIGVAPDGLAMVIKL